MKSAEETTLNLTRDPVQSLIARVAIPAAVGNLFNVLFNIVDSWFAGQLSTEALAGLSLSFPLFFVFIVLGAAAAAGGGALIGNALGAEDRARARRWCYQLLVLALIFSVLIMLAGLGVEPVFRLLGAEGEYLAAATEYTRTLYFGAPCLLMPFAINAGLTAQGRTTVYRNVLIVGFFANLVLNPWFIYGGFGLPAMGIKGIALATLLVQGLGAVYLWLHLRRTGLVGDLLHDDLKPRPRQLAELLVQAAPLAASMSAIGAFFFLANAYINSFGAAAVAAYGIGLRVEQLVLVPAMAINHAALVLTSNNLGAKQFDRVYESWYACIRTSGVLLITGGVLILLFGSHVMRAFSSDETVVDIGVGYLMIEAFALPAYALIHTNGGVLQGLKRPQAVMWIGVARSLALPAICLPIMIDWADLGLTSIWWMILALAWASGLVLHWHTQRVMRQNCPR